MLNTTTEEQQVEGAEEAWAASRPFELNRRSWNNIVISLLNDSVRDMISTCPWDSAVCGRQWLRQQLTLVIEHIILVGDDMQISQQSNSKSPPLIDHSSPATIDHMSRTLSHGPLENETYWPRNEFSPPPQPPTITTTRAIEHCSKPINNHHHPANKLPTKGSTIAELT